MVIRRKKHQNLCARWVVLAQKEPLVFNHVHVEITYPVHNYTFVFSSIKTLVNLMKPYRRGCRNVPDIELNMPLLVPLNISGLLGSWTHQNVKREVNSIRDFRAQCSLKVYNNNSLSQLPIKCFTIEFVNNKWRSYTFSIVEKKG